MSSGTTLTPELAWSMVNFLLSINRWYETGNLVDYLTDYQPLSKDLKQLKTQVTNIKLVSLIDAYVHLGLNDLDNKNYISARDNFERSLKVQKDYKIEYDGLNKLLEMATVRASAEKIK